MNKTTKALILLNMGGARNKDELKMFLTNMFNDKNILTIKNSFIRKFVASMIVKKRVDEAWENYKLIGDASPINPLTEKLVERCNEKLKDFKTYQVMRYTPPFAKDVIAKLKDDNIQELILLPLYPQYSTTTTKSSLEDFIAEAKDSFKISSIYDFYSNEKYNLCIVDEIARNIKNNKDYNLIFSAHGLPQKIVDNGDPYEKQLNEHIEILKELLKSKNLEFKSINLAYQSKVGPLKWLEPSLEDMLKNFKDEKVLIYPISFIVDNSETDFELSIEYKEFADSFGIKDYKVCKCVNYSDDFILAIEDIILK